MDLLVDIIVLIVKGLTKPRQPQAPALTPQQAAAQQAATQQRLVAMQQAMAAQQERVLLRQAVRQRRPAAAAGPTPATRTLSTNFPMAAARTSTQARLAPPSGLLVPLILGEILAPPLALREPEL